MKSDQTIWLDIVVSHQPPTAIGASHYVPVVQLEINETTTDLTQEPQNTETFTVQHSLDSNSNTYSVRASAYAIYMDIAPGPKR